MSKPTELPLVLAAELAAEPTAQMPVPPAAKATVGSVPEDESSSWYESREEMEEGNEEEHSG